MSRPQKGTNQFVLLTARRFLPLFLTQFLGAFNDNFFKSALMMLITYRLGDAAGVDPRVMVNAAAGAFILPFFLFAAPASDLADRYDRSCLMRAVKLAEIVIMAGAALGFYLNNLWLLMGVLFVPMLCAGLLMMAKDLGIDVVVEGVETEKQVNFLQSIVC